MELRGCSFLCAKSIHGLTEFDVLISHSTFQSKSQSNQRLWINEFFNSHCPNDAEGNKDFKNIKYILCGKTVCQLEKKTDL